MTERTLAVGGVPVGVVLEGSIPEAAVTALFGTVPEVDAPARVRVTMTAGAATRPARRPDVSYAGVDLWRSDAEITLAYGGVSATVAGRCARVTGPADAIAAALHGLLPHVAAPLLAHEDVFVLHGGLVIDPAKDAALLLLGISGRGKSTVALTALEHHWAAPADDITLLRVGATGPEVATIGAPLHVPADLGGRVAASAPVLAGDRRSRRFVTVAPEPWRPLGGVVVIEHGTTPESVGSPLAMPRAVPALLDAFTANRDAPLRARYLPAATAACRVGTWRLALGSDASRRLATTMAALRRISDRVS